MRPACIRCCWRSAASAMCRMPSAAGRRNCSRRPTRSSGQGQLSLAKYLWIVERRRRSEPRHSPRRSVSLQHMLARVDWRRDLHFQTCTTIDTLDYSGSGAERRLEARDRRSGAGDPLAADRAAGRSAAAERHRGGPRRAASGLPQSAAMPAGRASDRRAELCSRDGETDSAIERFCAAYTSDDAINRFPLVVIVDDSDFVAASLGNFLWVTFTRSNPAADVYGIESFTQQQALGLPRLARDRCPHEAAPRPAARRRPGRHATRRCSSPPPAARCMESSSH